MIMLHSFIPNRRLRQTGFSCGSVPPRGKKNDTYENSKRKSMIIIIPSSAPTAYEAKSLGRAVWRTVFQAQLDFIGYQDDMLHSAPGNGYLLSTAILDVIRCAAMGTAITLVLILGCLLHLHYPRALRFLRRQLRPAALFAVETSSDTDSWDYRSKLWPEPLNSLQLMTKAAWLEITGTQGHTPTDQIHRGQI